MEKRDTMSKRERLVKGLKSFGRLRIQANRTTVMSYSALILILFVAFVNSNIADGLGTVI